jgi:hypothetical protein
MLSPEFVLIFSGLAGLSFFVASIIGVALGLIIADRVHQRHSDFVKYFSDRLMSSVDDDSLYTMEECEEDDFDGPGEWGRSVR